MDDYNHVDGVHHNVFPLLSDDYAPLNEDKVKVLKEETKTDSVVVLPGDMQLYSSDEEHWLSKDKVNNAKVKPIYPGDAGANP